MSCFYAQPYDISAQGFSFRSADEYAAKVSVHRNANGQPVEEFEIQFLDGDGIDSELFEAFSVGQSEIAGFIEAERGWSVDQKVRAVIAVRELGYRFDFASDDPERLKVDLYEIDSLRDLAIQFVDEGVFGEIPNAIAGYLDYDAIARDLACDSGTVTVDGVRYVYRGA